MARQLSAALNKSFNQPTGGRTMKQEQVQINQDIDLGLPPSLDAFAVQAPQQTRQTQKPDINQTEFAPLSKDNYIILQLKDVLHLLDDCPTNQGVSFKKNHPLNLEITLNLRDKLFYLGNKGQQPKPYSFEKVFSWVFKDTRNLDSDYVAYNQELIRQYDEKYNSPSNYDELPDSDYQATEDDFPVKNTVKEVVKVAQVPTEAQPSAEPKRRGRKPSGNGVDYTQPIEQQIDSTSKAQQALDQEIAQLGGQEKSLLVDASRQLETPIQRQDKRSDDIEQLASELTTVFTKLLNFISKSR